MVGFILLHGVLPVVVFALAFLIEKKYAKASLQENMSQLWTQASLLKTLYISFAVVIGFALLVLFVNLYSVIISLEWGGKPRADGTLAPINVQNLALAFIGTVSGLGALFGVYLAILRSEENKRQNDVAEQGLITDRFNKATENLGKIDKDGDPIIEVRIGALYALERIAQDSIRDHVQIIKMLCDYICHNSAKPHERGEEKIHDTTEIKNKRKKNAGTKIDGDIQTALTIIGHRLDGIAGKERLKKEEEHKYAIKLLICNLYRAHLTRADLSCAILMGSDLRGAHLELANLSNTAFCFANMSGVCLSMANLDDADFDNAKMTTAHAYTGDFSNCQNLTQEQLNEMYCGLGVDIPTCLKRPDHWPTDDEPFDVFAKKRKDWTDSKYPPLHSL